MSDPVVVARVVLDSPLPQLDRIFEYAIPPRLQSEVVAGIRIKVPLRTGGRIVQAYVVAVTDTPEYAGKLAEIDSVISPAVVCPPELLRLARAVADRQAGTVADVLRLAIPPRSARLETQWLDDESGERAARAAAPAVVSSATELLQEFYGDALSPLDRTRGDDAAQHIALRAPVGMRGGTPRALVALIELATVQLVAGRSALLLVPDFRDVDLAYAEATALLDASRVRRFDARLKPKPRYDEFLRALEPIPQLIIGTRAAVYAPAHNLGLVMMWCDDDESFIEPRAPYAPTREVALIRATEIGASVVLASHAPSLEAARLIRSGWLRAVAPTRTSAPHIIPAAATIGDDERSRTARIPSAAWRAAKAGLDEGAVLMQVGRAGYRPNLACATCHTAARCTNCGGPLGQRSDDAVPACTVCGELHGAWQCPECGGHRLRASAIGHERTAEELGRAFPKIPVVVADGARELVTVPQEPCLVIATRGAEPVVAGGYRAVILLDTERALAREALDAQVDAMRTWSNAAALAADDADVIMTGAPSTPLIALRDWRQPAWAMSEFDERAELHFPPAVRVAVVTGTHDEVAATIRRLEDLGTSALQVLGPTPDAENPDHLRAVIRFPYRAGAEIAAACKAELVARATARRRAGRNLHGSTLRVHFDVHGVF